MNQTTLAIQEILIENKEQIFAFGENEELACLEINKGMTYYCTQRVNALD